MGKKIVNSFLGNRIYLAKILKDGTMSDVGREDITEDAIYAVTGFMKSNLEAKGMSRLIIHGVGVIQFTPEDKLDPELREMVREMKAAHDKKNKGGRQR